MAEAIVDLNKLAKEFPGITKKSQEFAKRILPLYASPELAAIAAALMTDGHIDWYTSDGRPRTRKIVLYSSNRAECEWFLNLVRKIFGTEGRIQAYFPKAGYFKKQPYKAVVHNATVARILILAGVPAGNKTEKEFLVPQWIMNGSKEIKSEFLRAFFTFEGSKPKKRPHPCSFQIALFMVKSEKFLQNAIYFFSQIKELLAGFGVSTSKIGNYDKHLGSKDGKKKLHLAISGQISIINFYRNLGYFNPEKQKPLEEAAIAISKFGRTKAKPVCLLIAELKNAFGTDRMLAFEINRLTVKKYSNRQIEHYRRSETAVPLELLFALIKIKKEKNILGELPEHIKFLYDLNPSVPLPP